MRRLFVFLSVSFTCAILALSCQVKELAPDIPTNYRRGAVAQGEVTLNAYADDSPGTKTGLDANRRFIWNPGDEIMVFSAGEVAKFTAINTEPASAAKFRGTVSFIMGHDETGDISYSWALYPYNENAVYEEPDGISKTATITTYILNGQIAKADSFGDGYAVSIGRAETLDIYFKNAYSGFFITFSRSDITSIELKSLNNESLAGRYTIGLDDSGSVPTPYVKEVVSGLDKITLYAPEGGTFQPGVRYYIITLPDVSIQTGVSFTAYRSDGYEGTYTLNSTRPFNRNAFRNLSDPVDVRIENQGTGWIKPGDNQIWYTTDNHEVCEYKVSASTGNVVVSNTYDAVADKGVITFESPLTVLDDKAFYMADYSSQLSSVTLPQSLQVIGESSFELCWRMMSVSMGNNVTSIGYKAFYNCQNLRAIQLPDGLQELWPYAFGSNMVLESVEIPSSLNTIGANPFYYTPQLSTFRGNGATADGAFLLTDNGERLVSFAKANPVHKLSCTIPQGVKTLGGYSLGYSEFTSLSLPDGLKEIEDFAMVRCQYLSELTIPSSVQSIGNAAFRDCFGLTKIVMKGATPPTLVTTAAFSGSTCPIYVPLGSKANYLATTNWGDLESRIVESEYPADNQIYYTGTAEAVCTLPTDSTNEFDSDQTRFFSDLGYGFITFKQPLTILDDGLFYSSAGDNHALTGVVLPETLEKIGNASFRNCRSLASVKMGNNVTVIDQLAFYGCSMLSQINFSNSLEVIGSQAFYDTHLTNVSLPQSLTCLNGVWAPSLGRYNDSGTNSFGGCNDIQSFSGKFASSDGAFLIDGDSLYSFASANRVQNPNCVIPSGVQYICQGAFMHSSNLQTVTLPESMVWIFGYVFFGSTLKEINIPASVQTLASQSFGWCENLTTVRMEASTAPNLVNNAFAASPSVVIYVPGYNTGYDSGNWASMAKTVYQADNEVWFHGTGTDFELQCNRVKAACGQNASEAEAMSWTVDANKTYEPAVPFPSSTVTAGSTVCVVKFPEPVQEVVDNGLENGSSPYQGWYEGQNNTTLGVLEYMSLPRTVTSIGSHAFSGHAGLAAFPAYFGGIRLRTIGESAFSGCSSIETVNLQNVERIERWVFSGADNLYFVTFGPNLNYLGYEFLRVQNPNADLAIQFLGTTPPTLAPGAFGLSSGYYSNITFLVPTGTLAAYQQVLSQYGSFREY